MGARTEVILAARVPRHVADRLRAAARHNDRSVSGEIRRLLRAWAEAQVGEETD